MCLTQIIKLLCNLIAGSADIQKFLLERLPSFTSHQIHSLDAQPIDDVFVGGQTTVLVQAQTS